MWCLVQQPQISPNILDLNFQCNECFAHHDTARWNKHVETFDDVSLKPGNGKWSTQVAKRKLVTMSTQMHRKRR